MKRIIICLLLTVSVFNAHAQLTAMAEDFEASCHSATGFPSDWLPYNPIATTISNGQWACAPGNGRYGTNGIKCTGVWGTPSAYHLDTSYLVSPALNLSTDTGHIYLHFDTKVSNINLGARLAMILTSRDTIYDTTGGGVFSDQTAALTPLFTNEDSTDWVTHVADLTPFKGDNPLYVAFRYTSNTTTGSTWYIDNIYTTSAPTGVPRPRKEMVAFNVVGNSTSSTITLSCKATSQGQYHLAIYDLMGKEVHNENIFLPDSRTTYTMGGLSLSPGMYLVKLGNGIDYRTAKAIVQ